VTALSEDAAASWPDAVLATRATDPELGLSIAEAARRLKRHGTNALALVALAGAELSERAR